MAWPPIGKRPKRWQAAAAHTGTSHVVAAAAAQGPGLLFGLSGSSVLSQATQWLFLTSLFATRAAKAAGPG
jgi:hypothetical protein